MTDRSEDRPEFLATHHQTWTHTTRHSEQTQKHTGVDGNRSECDKCNTNQRARWLRIGERRVGSVNETGLRVDKRIWNKGENDENKGPNNLTEEDIGEMSPRYITAVLVRG